MTALKQLPYMSRHHCSLHLKVGIQKLLWTVYLLWDVILSVLCFQDIPQLYGSAMWFSFENTVWVCVCVCAHLWSYVCACVCLSPSRLRESTEKTQICQIRVVWFMWHAWWIYISKPEKPNKTWVASSQRLPECTLRHRPRANRIKQVKSIKPVFSFTF